MKPLNSTFTDNREQLCQIILKSISKCTSYEFGAQDRLMDAHTYTELNNYLLLTASRLDRKQLKTTLTNRAFEIIVRRGENTGYHPFLLFPIIFSTLSKTNIVIQGILNLSSAKAFDMDQSKILSFSKELTLSKQQILESSKLKEFADNNL